jgi:hypothetical protein
MIFTMDQNADNSRKKATRDRWKAEPLPESVARLQYTRTFSAQEYEKLSYGLIPNEMEDKWFIYLEQGHLYFHRSWTGVCVYRVRFERVDETYFAIEALVNRDPTKYKETDDAYDTALLSFLIENFLLGGHTPFPLPTSLSKGLPKGLFQHSFSGSSYREVEFDKKKIEN